MFLIFNELFCTKQIFGLVMYEMLVGKEMKHLQVTTELPVIYELCPPESRKHCGKRKKKKLVTSKFSFFYNVFKRLLTQNDKNLVHVW